jgi:hypothetical protein
MRVQQTEGPPSGRGPFYFSARPLLGLFQYGLLHLGHTRGSSSGSGGFLACSMGSTPRGTHG